MNAQQLDKLVSARTIALSAGRHARAAQLAADGEIARAYGQAECPLSEPTDRQLAAWYADQANVLISQAHNILWAVTYNEEEDSWG